MYFASWFIGLDFKGVFMLRFYLFLLVFTFANVFANDTKTLNKYGFAGVNKTQSAQSLGHSKLSFSILGNITNDNTLFRDRGHTRQFTENAFNIHYNSEEGEAVPDLMAPSNAYVGDFIAGTAYISLGIGIWNYFDLGVTLPFYYEQFEPEVDFRGISGTTVGGIGNLKTNLKLRFPLPEDQPIDIALFGGADIGTANTKKDGMWVREAEYINFNTNNAESFGNPNFTFRGGLGITADFSKLGDDVPWLIHLNGGYRYVLPNDDDKIISDVSPYSKIIHASVATEFFFFEFLSFFAEYYVEFMEERTNLSLLDPNAEASENKQALDLGELTGALVFHTPIGLDFHLGATYSFVNERYISNLRAYHVSEPHFYREFAYDGRVVPEYSVYAGVTWSGFLLPQDADGDGILDKDDACPYEFGHPRNAGCPFPEPDIDGDGVCDPWVAEKGFLDLFEDQCVGIDQCPTQVGDVKNNGCPLDNPDTDGDGVCDPWVKQKKMSKHFKDICKGVDSCPNEPGPDTNNGCPMDNPDSDGDGLCDPWVTQKNKLQDFAGICRGYDNCPGEAGPKENGGCPWPDPDTDGDGLCDPWVTEKKMGYYFENAKDPSIKKCKALDRCPYDFGPADNDGCPFDNPDTDGDGLCDPWVSEKNQSDRFADICTGIDKCPNEAGPTISQGCPTDDPDPDKDGVCSPWVLEKGMQDAFKEVCQGVDKCPTEVGPIENQGCPLDDPDLDNDGVCAPWVTEKGLHKLFEGVCVGLDKCPLEAGEKENDGCPLDNPDTDGDGVCDPWVTQKNMLDKFKDVCTGLDRCPLDSGAVSNNGCPVPQIEENVKLEGVTFKSGSSVLEPNAKRVLKGIAEQLLAPENKSVKIEIHGHTDNVGRPAANKKLSQQRAQSVINYLASQGVPKSRMEAYGHGDEEPVADNKTAEGRELNRRIEMHRLD